VAGITYIAVHSELMLVKPNFVSVSHYA